MPSWRTIWIARGAERAGLLPDPGWVGADRPYVATVRPSRAHGGDLSREGEIVDTGARGISLRRMLRTPPGLPACGKVTAGTQGVPVLVWGLAARAASQKETTCS